MQYSEQESEKYPAIAVNDRVYLRPLKNGDAHDVTLALSTEEVKNLSHAPYPYKLSDAIKWIDINLKEQEESDLHFCVCYSAQGFSSVNWCCSCDWSIS